MSSEGAEADGNCHSPAISADGRFVAFASDAFTLVPTDNTFQFRTHVYVRDRVAGTTERVSVSTAGEEGNSESVRPKTSDDGLVTAFQSNASNLVPEDTSPTTDIFVHDRTPPADLSLAKLDSPDPVEAKTELTYTVTVTSQPDPNPADNTATETTVVF